ncbi:hypothetical protein L615_004200000240 [Nocardioides sp. J9]|uniref:hypothetical protein n=1 Tax=unclassified Nocardioides TaxID=2615069 RepID=UPI00048DEADE|nr:MULTISPECIES: hypothetical protein [unclassified Nocardioides]TWG96448.1 hypothetical protein L615_004200000240 [Nocardioides sp. J9]
MSAIPVTDDIAYADAAPQHAATRMPAELEQAILEIAASERALDDLLGRADRLHASNIQHDPRSCLVCFTER